MNKQDAGQITSAYLKPVYGFALKRCRNLQDAEDLSQEIMLRILRTLLLRCDIEDTEKYVWTIAHNALSNYYRDRAHRHIGTPIEELSETIHADEPEPEDALLLRESEETLHREIARLAKLQRQIVIAYYYEKRRQSEIADMLGIPVGTVKWHLFEARKELKRGMETVEKTKELSFNPIFFAMCGTNGSPGTLGSCANFFRTALSQNIAYTVRKEAKSVNEIAEILNVSPVYVENEAEYLEKYGFLTKQGGKYLGNILLDETNSEISRLHDEMYDRAAAIFAPELYDALISSDIWEDPGLQGGYTDGGERDRNFLLWALIPYIAAYSGEHLLKAEVSFEQAATRRPDGGHNICYASVINPAEEKPKYFDSMQNFCGMYWDRAQDMALYQIDTEWSARRVDNQYHLNTARILTLLSHERRGTALNEEEYAWLVEGGFLKMAEGPDQEIKALQQCVWLEGAEIKKRLLSFGDRIREKYHEELEALRKPYIEAVLRETPRHLHTMQKYGLQFTFYSDGWFILHCLKTLVNAGKLLPPKESQKQSLSMIILHE